ncbi:MAG: sporulation protein YqfD [Clostridium sp.]|nr:sporulation protein YqfD [Clostridium sp.]
MEWCINVITKNGISIWNLKRISVNTMEFDIKYNDYKDILKIAKKAGSKIKIIKRSGKMFFWFKMIKRSSIVIGLIMFIAIITYLSNFIWGIDIETENNIAPYEIRQDLKDMGIKPGTNKNNINVYDIEEKLKNKNSDIMWIRVRIKGSKLIVTSSERQSLPKANEDNTTCNLTAKKDGVILWVYTKAGTPIVKGGDVVKKGQILVSGEEGKEGSTYQVHAAGSVYAKTYYEETRKVPLTYTKKTRTGECITNYYIYIFGKKIYLKNSLNKFAKYDKIVKDDNFIKKETFYKVEEKVIKISPKICENNTADAIYKNIISNFDRNIKVINKNVYEDVEQNMIKVRVLVTAEEDISETTK